MDVAGFAFVAAAQAATAGWPGHGPLGLPAVAVQPLGALDALAGLWWGMAAIHSRTEIREFLSSRRARLAPEQAGLPAYGGNRRVKGLRREEVALLAEVSVDHYVRMERGNLAGASDGVLDALASALHLDEAERDHLFHLARQSRTPSGPRRRRPAGTVRSSLHQVLDALSDAPAWIGNGRYDVLAMNRLARALYSPVLADPRRPANTARFVYPNPEAARDFLVE